MEAKTIIQNDQKKWLCSQCRFTLAFVEDKKIVRIKRKDLYVEVEGGRVKVICCRCGKPNELLDHNGVINDNGREGNINGL